MKNKKINLLMIILFILYPFRIHASFNNDLHYGMLKNEDVAALQEFLTTEGFYAGSIGGNYLSLTKNAIKAFQKNQNIVPNDGLLGQKTRQKINEILTPPATTKDALYTKTIPVIISPKPTTTQKH
jgi:peptidoglycan hydrolase-like protein with peptidoglycan-binding domain